MPAPAYGVGTHSASCPNGRRFASPSPTAVIRLLESGQLPSHLGADGRRRRIARADLETHRTERFALRQQMVQEQRALRWAEASGVPPATRDPGADDMPDRAG